MEGVGVYVLYIFWCDRRIYNSGSAGKDNDSVLHRLKFGQEIREEGPKWHAKKSGNTDYGRPYLHRLYYYYDSGVLFNRIWSGMDIPVGKKIFMLLVISIAYGIIGFIDDYIKVILKRNLGLTAKQKFLLQTIVAVAFVCWAVYGEGILRL